MQVKSGEGNVGAPEVQALSGAVADKGASLSVTLAGFTKQARGQRKPPASPSALAQWLVSRIIEL